MQRELVSLTERPAKDIAAEVESSDIDPQLREQGGR